MTQTSRERAMKDPAAHAYERGSGYLRLGRPELPRQPLASASACEPPMGVADGSWHMLQPPMGVPLKRMKWNAGKKIWTPMMLGAGKRLAFGSDYLAAHGWTYARASNAMDLLGDRG